MQTPLAASVWSISRKEQMEVILTTCKELKMTISNYTVSNMPPSMHSLSYNISPVKVLSSMLHLNLFSWQTKMTAQSSINPMIIIGKTVRIARDMVDSVKECLVSCVILREEKINSCLVSEHRHSTYSNILYAQRYVRRSKVIIILGLIL